MRAFFFPRCSLVFLQNALGEGPGGWRSAEPCVRACVGSSQCEGSQEEEEEDEGEKGKIDEMVR